MTKDDIFTDLLAILAGSDSGIDVSGLALDDEPFHVHGIDSLALLRLIGEVEKKFDIELDDSDALIAFSFERLVDLIAERRGDAVAAAPTRRNYLDVVEARAAQWAHAGSAPELRFRPRRGDDVALTFDRLLRVAAGLASELPAPMPGRPQVLLVAATDPLVTVAGFLAGLYAEALPLVLPAPKSIGGMESYLGRIADLVGRFDGHAVLALEAGVVPDRAALPVVPVFDLPGDLQALQAPAELPSAQSRPAGDDDIAFLQMTSASTGDGKLVAVSHANICANLDSMLDRLDLAHGTDRTCSWLPLYHDMGLIGGVLFPLYGGFSTVLMRPADFIKDPGSWIRTISELRCTFSGAPNFAIDYAALAVGQADLDGVDLSCLRRFGLAAEPIHLNAVRRFVDRFGPHGLRPDSLVPGLGMAESTLSTTTRVGRDPRYLLVESGGTVVGDPVRIVAEGVITYPETPGPAAELDAPGTVAVFSLGTAMAGLEVDVRDEDGRPIEAEGVLGEIAVRGDSVVVGYYDPATGGATGFEDGVLMSGAPGFLHGGELFVLERRKNVIIRHGANFLASLLEQRVAEILGIPAHGLLVMEEDLHAANSPIHVVVENAQHLPEPDGDQVAALRRVELPVDLLTYAAGFAIPRTTSGKKRYHLCRQDVAAGKLETVARIDLREKRDA